MSDIADRLARLEDRAELQDLIVRYFLAADNDDTSGLAATFADDARFSISGWIGGSTRNEVIAFLVGEREKMGLTVHTPNYALFTFTDTDRASGLVGAHLELVCRDTSVFGAVRYQDEYVRGDGTWRIRSRDMRTIHIAPWAEVGEAFASSRPVRWPGIDHAPSDFPRKSQGLAC